MISPKAIVLAAALFGLASAAPLVAREPTCDCGHPEGILLYVLAVIKAQIDVVAKANVLGLVTLDLAAQVAADIHAAIIVAVKALQVILHLKPEDCHDILVHVDINVLIKILVDIFIHLVVCVKGLVTVLGIPIYLNVFVHVCAEIQVFVHLLITLLLKIDADIVVKIKDAIVQADIEIVVLVKIGLKVFLKQLGVPCD